MDRLLRDTVLGMSWVRLRWQEVIVFFASMLPGVLYALLTEHAWEDFFINIRFTHNFCAGHGLVFHPGERVQGFTSPMVTLLPAFACLWWGESVQAALTLLRICSLVALGCGALLLWRSTRHATSGSYQFALLTLCFCFLDIKGTLFATNGMEIGFMILFVCWLLSIIRTGPEKRVAELAVVWAGLQWTRPDGCVYAAASLVIMMIGGKDAIILRSMALARAAAFALVLYSPWLIFASWYYGSPVPHSLIAKGFINQQPGEIFSGWYALLGLKLKNTFDAIFGPLYFPLVVAELPGWYRELLTVLGYVCALYWIIPGVPHWQRSCSGMFLLMALYLSFLGFIYPWYAPPLMVPASVVLADLIIRISCWGKRVVPAPVALALLALPLVAVELWMFMLTVRQISVQQREIENGTRREIGIWLNRHVPESERIYLEPLGYIGYFSQRSMIGWPGQVNPDLVNLRRESKVNFYSAAEALKPEWMVLRSHEIPHMAPALMERYQVIKEFDAFPRLSQYSHIPLAGYLRFDARFTVFRLKSLGMPVESF